MKKQFLIVLMSFLTLNVFAQPNNWNQQINFVNYEFNTNCYVTDLIIEPSDWVYSEFTYNPDSTIHKALIYFNIPFDDTLTYSLSLTTSCGCFLDTTFTSVVHVGYVIYHNFSFGTSNPQWNTNWTGCVVGVEELSVSKKIIKVLDETGRDAISTPNGLFIYVYDDGSRERKVIVK